MKNQKAVQEIVNICKSCKEVETYYKNLIEVSGFDKESAKEIIKSAKEVIKSKKSEAKQERDFVTDWFKDYEKVGKSLLIGICKEEGVKFAEIANKFELVIDFVREYVTKGDTFGNPIRNTKSGYMYKSVTAQNIRSLLRECVRNYVSELHNIEVGYIRIETAEIVEK